LTVAQVLSTVAQVRSTVAPPTQALSLTVPMVQAQAWISAAEMSLTSKEQVIFLAGTLA
jgi:hypothetical protein